MYNKYYVYEWIRLDTNEPFYVGKGHNDRWRTLRHRNEWFINIVNKHNVAVNILHDNLDEQTAFGLECWYIHEYKYIIGYELCNITDGGEGIALVGEKNPRYGKGYLIEGENHPFYGKHQTEEFKKRLSEMQKGEGNNMYGKHHSEETKNKLALSNQCRKPVYCIELNKEFNSMIECMKYMKEKYKITMNRTTFKKILDGNHKKDYYKEIYIDGVLIKLHWKYIEK